MIGLAGALVSCGGGGSGVGDGLQTSSEGLSAGGASEFDTSTPCGQAGPLTSDLIQVYEETEQCVGLSAPPPAVVFSPTVPCPTSGELRCLESVDPFPCSYDPSKSCGATGRYLASCNAIELPDQYSGAAAHEMIHHVLRMAGREDWAQHESPEFACQ
ncbi:MAG: hypothetical protein ACREQQ_09060 [Candidatus Binatia bacterium]